MVKYVIMTLVNNGFSVLFGPRSRYVHLDQLGCSHALYMPTPEVFLLFDYALLIIKALVGSTITETIQDKRD